MNKQDICIGTGLVALDVILNGKPETPPRLHAGGSCGNVLSILSFLGWSSFPIARLAKNSATKEIEKDFKKWDVKTLFISKTFDGSTPIIIHRILKDEKGNPKHRFEFRDPETDSWLPGYKPVLYKEVDSIVSKQPHAKVFYFDRINRGSIELAKANKENGATIFFEPSSIGAKEELFKECLQVADVVKFSHDRISNYSQLFPKQQVPLEIETRGVEGIRYRFSISKKKEAWQTINAYKINDVIDAAGAGDWCSAGIIDKLCKRGAESFNDSNGESIKSAILYGQLLGALNCCFDGARGIMYNLNNLEFSKIVRNIEKAGSYDLTNVTLPKPLAIAKRKPLQISSLYS